MKKVFVFAAISVLLCSCSDRLTDFTVISTKNFPVGQSTPTTILKADKRVKGVDKKHTVLFVPLGFPNLKTAIDRAIESYPGAIGLADGVVKSNWWSVFLYGQNSYVVEGTPIYEDRSGAPAATTTVATPAAVTIPERTVAPETTLLFYHEVKAGESLADIAKIYDVSVGDIIKWNSLSSTNIQKGTKLKVQVK